MNRRFLLALCLFLASWMVPITRAVNFLSNARDYVAETQSLDAANDLTMAWRCVAAYTFAMACGFLALTLAARRRSALLAATCALGMAIPVWLIWCKPEEPVVFFPRFAPQIVLPLAVWPVIFVVLLRAVRYDALRQKHDASA